MFSIWTERGGGEGERGGERERVGVTECVGICYNQTPLV